MERLESVITKRVELEIIECDCGYHMGIDAKYLEETGDFITNCPSCGLEIDTAIILPA